MNYLASTQPANFKGAPRCQHTKMNGAPCSAPARRGRHFCVFHEPAHSQRPDYSLAVIEDATSLQFAVMQIMRALADKAIDHKSAALMLYGLQIAAGNLKRFAAEQPDNSEEGEKSLAEILLERLGLEDEEEEQVPPANTHPQLADELGNVR